MTLSVIIISYNTKKYILDCLESIFKFLPRSKMNFEVIVIDNNSSDGSSEAIKKRFPQVKLIESKENLGFGKANNVAAGLASGKYLLFLNSDTLLSDDSFKKAIEYFEKNKKTGVIGPKIMLPDGSVQPASFGNEPSLLTLLLTKFQKASVKSIQKEVGWVTGACLFIRHDLFKKLKGFDDQFFMYFEDIDLCMSSQRAGYKVILFPDVQVTHLLGKSLKSNWQRKKIYWDSQKKFYRKHYGFWGGLLVKAFNLPRDLYLKLKLKNRS